VAGVALGDIHLRFAWQAWHLWHWAASGDALGRPCRFAWQAWHLLGDLDLPFAWQARHLATLVTLTFHLRGRRGAWRHPPAFCVAGVALGSLWWRAWAPLPLCVAGVALVDIDVPFAWQAWHACVWRVRHGTYGTGLALVARLGLAGVALGDIDVPFAWQAGHFGDIRLRFAWHAWHARGAAPLCVAGLALLALVLLVARLGAVSR